MLHRTAEPDHIAVAYMMTVLSVDWVTSHWQTPVYRLFHPLLSEYKQEASAALTSVETRQTQYRSSGTRFELLSATWPHVDQEYRGSRGCRWEIITSVRSKVRNACRGSEGGACVSCRRPIVSPAGVTSLLAPLTVSWPLLDQESVAFVTAR